MRASARAAAIARLTLTKKAYDVAVLDLRGLTTMADFFVVCSADTEIQIKAIADAVEDGMEERRELLWHREAGSPNWVLLDYVDVVLHIFHKDARLFYSLEKLWGDAVITPVTDGPSDSDLGHSLEEKAKFAGIEELPRPPEKVRVKKVKTAAKKGGKGTKKRLKGGTKRGNRAGALTAKRTAASAGSKGPRGDSSSSRAGRTP